MIEFANVVNPRILASNEMSYHLANSYRMDRTSLVSCSEPTLRCLVSTFRGFLRVFLSEMCKRKEHNEDASLIIISFSPLIRWHELY